MKKVHMVGVGGSGLSALAKAFLSRGIEVSGSDAQTSNITENLENLGLRVKIGHRSENVPARADCLVYTVAAEGNNPEIEYAKSKGIPVFSYPEMLGMMSRNFFTIAIAGTHGKTTTTNMVGKILTDAGLDPLVIAGAPIQRGSEMYGKGKYFVVEACEYKRSFLNIYPDIAIITNIDDDHLDYYKNREDIESAFSEFIANLKEGGRVMGDFQNPKYESRLDLRVPGRHNVRNAMLALGAALEVGVSPDVAIKSLNDFSGAERRFEFKGKSKNGALVFDDYAHHPTEIEATISAAKEKYPDLKLTIIFQPHLYSRTKEHLERFATELKRADRVIMLPIYAAREEFDVSVKSEDIVNRINALGGNAEAIGMNEAIKCVGNLGPDSLIMTMGAGDVYKVGDAIRWFDRPRHKQNPIVTK